MADKADVWQGTLALMILKTLETLGPLHGYGIARRIEQTSGDRLAVNYGTLYRPRITRMNTDQQLPVRVFREIRGRFDRSVRSVARSFYRWLLEQVLEISLTLEMRSVRAAI